MLGCGKQEREREQERQLEKKPRPADGQTLKCPRCDSANTKFCYYNNYSLSQPRYFCKSCRRYWTKGGTLRNVPVGGGCRKNRRPSSRSRSQDQSLCTSPNPFPPHPTLGGGAAGVGALPYEPSNLSYAIARLQKQTSLGMDDLPMMCNLGNAAGAAFGGGGYFDGAAGNTGLFQNLFYGGGGVGVESGGAVGGLEMGIAYDGGHLEGIGAATSAEGRDDKNSDNNNGGEVENGRGLLWSFPWQSVGGGGGGGNMGGFGSSWHGLLNAHCTS
ncbi:unnamed protein product [Cuscuta campestris]|uniref:Dof zinc finger protein n=1 Tax=Cuscuta campestris TaxID=132261 RepID=A0A484LK06_9ASTE|nr:unnamed protein product [Cuscuta campestris]